MIDFLNDALSTIEVKQGSLYPIYVDRTIVYKHYIGFSNDLLEAIEHYYVFKNKYCLSIESNYSYSLFFKETKKLSVICKTDYNKFLFYIEFFNVKEQRAILIGIEEDSSHLNVCFYSNYNQKDDYSKVVKRGELTLVSNMMNNGIGVHLVNIFYEFMENDHFDQENPFYNIEIN